MKHLRGLTLGETLGLQVAIFLTQLGLPSAIPSLVAIHIVAWLVMDDSSHRYLLPKLLPCWKLMAKDGEVALLFQPLPYRVASVLGRHRCEVADAVIETFIGIPSQSSSVSVAYSSVGTTAAVDLSLFMVNVPYRLLVKTFSGLAMFSKSQLQSNTTGLPKPPRDYVASWLRSQLVPANSIGSPR